MYGGDCDAARAKDATVVTHVQSQSQEVGSGDEGLGLCFDLSSAETDFWWLEDEQQRLRLFSPRKIVKHSKQKHKQHVGGDCDAAIAKAATAAVTHVQSQSHEVGSGHEGLGLLFLICHQQKRTFGGWRTSSRDFAYFRVSYDILRSTRKRSSPCVPTTLVVLKRPSQSIHTSREA